MSELSITNQFQIYTSLKQASEQYNKVLINCENAVYGRLLSTLSKILKNNRNCTVYLTNIDKIILKKDYNFYLNRMLRLLSAGSKDHGPYMSTTATRLFRERFAKMIDKNERQDFKARLITWKTEVQPEISFKINSRWHRKGFLYSQLIKDLNGGIYVE